ncbi:zinc finger BED domain-containing protein 4-like [Anoplophora glabripennis]|uniref:zinc finger BED domain-containing protein 4-like n=1 Tax=Anoplophora glabripennis TaxID=217634 RepID=UPI000874E593|nr:zinc finger BED domain-containing protein 4-like [Anoplophora glabripennis]
MSNHLKSKHLEKFLLVKKGKDKGVPAQLVEPAVPSTSSSSTLTEKQLTLSESFERKLLWDINDTKAKKYNYLIAEVIALDNELLSIVERVGFKRLLQQALPRYEMPSRTYITQKIVPDIYNKIFEKIKTSISNAVAVSVTSDMWTCLHNNSSFLSFTAHWLSPEFQLQHGVLAMKPFLGSHTGENIANEFNAIAARWDIEQSKVHVLVHDSGANMVKGVRMAEYNSARCFIHSFQRVVTESLKIQSEVMDMIAKGRRLVTHFNHSGLAQEKLLVIQKELSLPEHQLVQDINTRWNSTFYMAERLLEQKRAISLYVAEHDDKLTNLTTHQWCLMEQCVKLLKPFEEITKITSSGLSCISEVMPHVAALKKYLEKNETAQRTADLSRMRASLTAELESRFNTMSEDPTYLIATFLDKLFGNT